MRDEAILYIAAIKLPPGKLAAQVAHAAVACIRQAERSQNRVEILRSWDRGAQGENITSGQAKVVLRLENPDALIHFAASHGIPFAVIHDEGRTVVEKGTMTAIAIGPVLRSETGPWQTLKLY